MSGKAQPTLESLWKGGSKGRLSPLETLKAYCYWKVYQEQGESEYGLWPKIASKVTKVGGGHPSGEAVRQTVNKINDDPDWYPGKHSEESRGPKPALSGAARHSIKRSAEAMKAEGLEPTYGLVCARCPNAVRNPETGEPVDKKVVYNVFRSDCYDPGAELPWGYESRLQKVALSEDAMAKREAWADHMLHEVGHTDGWYYRHLLWIDFCHSILPRTEPKAEQQALARKGKRGWGSSDCRLYARNLQGKKAALQQNSYGTLKVWWFPVLTRGKLHVELLPAEFPGEKQEAVEQLISKIPGILSVRFPDQNKPKVIMSDRGPAFYNPGTGQITDGYREALRANGLRALMGDDASKQAGDSQEVMLHETAVAWLRKRLAATVPTHPWLETREQYGARLKQQAHWINCNYNVDGLCRRFGVRLGEVFEQKGGRLGK